MDAGNWIAIGSVGVAFVGIIVATWQGRVARRSAESAQISAEAARRQATLAEEQHEVIKRQADMARAEADEADGPVFEMKAGEVFFRRQRRYGSARLRMARGPALERVDVTVRGRWVEGLAQPPENDWGQHDLGRTSWPDVSEGAEIDIVAHIRQTIRSAGPVNLTVDLECWERGGRQRHWTRSVSVTLITVLAVYHKRWDL